MSTIASICQVTAWRRGVRLAIALLEELEGKQVEASLPDEDSQAPQEEIVLVYLHRARESGLVAERAFAAVLSDVLVDCESDLEALEECALSTAATRGRVDSSNAC